MKGSGLLNALLVAAVLAVCAGTASAATYYVDCDDPAASDSYSKEEAQSEAKPWKTLYSAGFHAQPGDTVLVKDGVCPDPEDLGYNDKDQVAYFSQDGESNGRQWTVFKAYPGHHPHIRFRVRQGEPSKNGIHIVGSYIIVDGFEVSPEDYPAGSYGGGNGIYVTRNGATGGISHHVIVRNCKVHDCPGSGIGGSCMDYVTIENNTVWNNSWWSCWNTSGVGFYQPHDSGIDFGATVVNGTAYRLVIANNRIYGNENKVPPSCISPQSSNPMDGNGIILDDFGSTQVYENSSSWMKEHKDIQYPHRTLIMNNVIYGNGGRGILAFISSHADILHNTVYNNLQSQGVRENCNALGDIACSGTDMRVFNNISIAQYKASFDFKNNIPFPGQSLPEKISYGNNLTYGGSIDTDSGASDAGGNIVQDPLLAAPGLNADSDFHLKKGSPAINKGSAANSVPKDFEGTSRPLGGLPDIGAYETNYAGGMCISPVIKLLLDGK